VYEVVADPWKETRPRRPDEGRVGIRDPGPRANDTVRLGGIQTEMIRNKEFPHPLMFGLGTRP
jgi:hypothetical protein